MKQLFLLSLLISCSLFSQEQTFKPVSFPEGYTSQLDVIYTQVNGWDGRMDLYFNPKSVLLILKSTHDMRKIEKKNDQQKRGFNE